MNLRAFALFGVLAVNLPTFSQAHPPSTDVPSAADARAEVFGGFSMAGGGLNGNGYGFNGGADFRLLHRVFLAADVNQFKDPPQPSNTMSETVYLVGPRFLVPLRPSSRTSVFAEFLAGGDTFHNRGQAYTFTYNSATTYALAADAGVDYAWSRHLSTRFEGGYLHNRLKYSTYGGPPSPSSAAENRGRLVVDLVYRF